ncbi:hypothetical protein CEXT_565141 [Caerostris extrusa]|uniref:Secreted protein n=1 Tax=Caerostris extrusa TaxID=172846 RepID=A0AAV4XAN8_CAEEX|nr:hypothetical protein CEXT_565141 [Caerostris extrusa]
MKTNLCSPCLNFALYFFLHVNATRQFRNKYSRNRPHRTWFFLDFAEFHPPFDYIFLIFNQGYGDNYQLLHAGRALRILRFAKMLSLWVAQVIKAGEICQPMGKKSM